MDVFALRDRLVGDYESYVGSFIKIKDARIEDEVMRSLDEGLLGPDPLIQLNPTFQAGESIDELVEEGLLHGECAGRGVERDYQVTGRQRVAPGSFERLRI